LSGGDGGGEKSEEGGTGEHLVSVVREGQGVKGGAEL
jgi:hypothetical protein